MSKQNRYSPQLWPNAPLPTPRVWSGSFVLEEGGWITSAFSAALRDGGVLPPADELRSPPHELHLRAMGDVDLSDEESLRALCDQVGEVVRPARPWLGVVPPESGFPAGLAQVSADHVGAQLGLPQADWDERPLDGVHVREIAWRVVIVRRLVDHVRAHLGGEPVAPGWQRIGAFNFDDDALVAREDALAERLGVRALSDESPEVLAWWLFGKYMRQALAEFSPRLIGPAIESEPDLSDVTSAFGAACAAIWNDLRDEVPYSYCADETCGRLFRRQLGRGLGINKARSSGVKYCTDQHARNQAQRERRRAQREESEA